MLLFFFLACIYLSPFLYIYLPTLPLTCFYTILPVYLSTYLRLQLLHCLFAYLCISVCPSMHLLSYPQAFVPFSFLPLYFSTLSPAALSTYQPLTLLTSPPNPTPACFSACVPSFLPAYLFTNQHPPPVNLSTYLPITLLTSPPNPISTCLSTCLPSFLTAYLPTNQHPYIFLYLLTYLSPCLPHHLITSPPASLLTCLSFSLVISLRIRLSIIFQPFFLLASVSPPLHCLPL